MVRVGVGVGVGLGVGGGVGVGVGVGVRARGSAPRPHNPADLYRRSELDRHADLGTARHVRSPLMSEHASPEHRRALGVDTEAVGSGRA